MAEGNHAAEWDARTLWMWITSKADSLDLDEDDIERMQSSAFRTGADIARAQPAQLSIEWGPPLDICEKIQNFIRTQAPPAYKQFRSRQSSELITVSSADGPHVPLTHRSGTSKDGHRLNLPNFLKRNSSLRGKVDFARQTQGLDGAGAKAIRCSLKMEIQNDLFMSRLCYPRWWIENGDCKRVPNTISHGTSIQIQLEGYPGETLQGLLSFVIYDMPYLPPTVFSSSMASMLSSDNPIVSMFPRHVLPPPFGTIFPKCFVNANAERENDVDQVKGELQTRAIVMWSVQIPKDQGSWMSRLATPRRLEPVSSGGSGGHHTQHSRNISTLSDLSFESLENLNRFAVTFVEDTEDLALGPDLFQDILQSQGAIAELEQSQTTNEIYEATGTMGNGPICDLVVHFEDVMVDTSTLLPDGLDLFGRQEADFAPTQNNNSNMVKLEDVMSMLQPRHLFHRAPSTELRDSSGAAASPHPARGRSRERGGSDDRNSLRAPRLDLQTPGDAYKTVSPLFSPRRVSSSQGEDEIQQSDRVLLENGKRGQVKVICQHEKWGYGTWYCIRLTEARGNNDGAWKGIRAFNCPARHGVMVQKRSIVQKLNEATFDFMEEDTETEDDQANEHRRQDSLIRIQQTWNNLTKQPHAPITFKEFAEIVKDSEANVTRSELRSIFNGISRGATHISYERFTTWYQQRKVEKLDEAREADSQEREQKIQEYKEAQVKGFGSAPRTVVVRQKNAPIEDHEGYTFIADADELFEDGKWAVARKKYEIGIKMLEQQLKAIDRSMLKRAWGERIEEFRHRYHRCQREIEQAKRKKKLAQRDKERRKHAKLKAKEEVKRMQKEVQEAAREAAGPEGIAPTTAADDLDEEPQESSESSDSEDEPAARSRSVSHRRSASTRKLQPEKSNKKKPKEKKLSQQDQELHDRIAGHVVDDAVSISFKDVMGLENVKLALYESIILPNIRPDIFRHIQKPTTGLLLFGPPGNGKTMIAKCVASECDATFFSISAAAITSKWVGEAERIMRTLFQVARQRQPSIIFIDEIDSMLTARGGANEHESSRRIKTEFLIQFDGVHGSEESAANVIVIGATNLPHQLDDAVLRRFPKRIMVPNPDPAARFGLMRLLISKHKHEMRSRDFRALSTDTDGYSCSDLSMVCQDVIMGPLRELGGAVISASADDIPPIGRRHFVHSIQNIRASTPAASLRMYDEWNSQYGSAVNIPIEQLPENMRSVIITSDDEGPDGGDEAKRDGNTLPPPQAESPTKRRGKRSSQSGKPTGGNSRRRPSADSSARKRAPSGRR